MTTSYPTREFGLWRSPLGGISQAILRYMGLMFFVLALFPGRCNSQAAEGQGMKGAQGMQPEHDLLSPDSDSVRNLETGQDLVSLLSSIHWNHFSILSFSGYEGYDTNSQMQKLPIGSSLTAFNALAIYSVDFAHTRLDLQYHPFIWLSQKATYKDFGSASGDLASIHNLSAKWRWTFADAFHYSPSEQSTIEGQSYSADFGQGLTVGSPFLSTGWNILSNDVRLRVEDRFNEFSALEFHGDQGYLRVSQLAGATVTMLDPTASPTQQLLSYGAGTIWTGRLDERNTVDISAEYRKQSSLGTKLGNGQYTLLTAGLKHLITPTFRVTAEAGPGWHSSGNTTFGHSRLSTTIQGYVEVFKQFRKGGVAASLIRSDQFTGVIGDTFNNRVDLTVDRHLSTRWNVTGTGSYLEQGAGNGRHIIGKFASAEVDYFLTRNWSLFVQGRYLGVLNGSPLFAPEKIATVGFRWAWVPDKP